MTPLQKLALEQIQHRAKHAAQILTSMCVEESMTRRKFDEKEITILPYFCNHSDRTTNAHLLSTILDEIQQWSEALGEDIEHD